MYQNPEAYLQSFGKGEWDIAIGPRILAPADKADEPRVDEGVARGVEFAPYLFRYGIR